METETEIKNDDCAFLMRIKNKVVAVCETGDGETCVIYHCPVPAGAGKSEKRTVSRIEAWIEITALLGSAAANVALPGVVRD